MLKTNFLRTLTKITAGSKALPSGSDTSNVAFVLSTGRTGTTFLANYLTKFDNVTAVHEPTHSRLIRMWTAARLEGHVDQGETSQVLKALTAPRYASRKPGLYVESNPMLVGFSDVVDTVFNDPVIIHIVRDPRDYIRSAMNFGGSSGIKLLFNKFVPYWFTDVEQILNFDAHDDMRLMYAGYWRVANSFIKNSLSQSSNYHLLKHEELFADNGENLDLIRKALGLKKSKKSIMTNNLKHNKSTRNTTPEWEQWSDDFCKSIAELCSPLMQEYGYGTEKSWLRKAT